MNWLKSHSTITGLIISIAGFTVAILFLLSIQSLGFTYSELLTVMGIWVMVGVVVGQNKPPSLNLKQYVDKRIVALTAIFILFAVSGLVFMVTERELSKEVSPMDVVGLLLLLVVNVMLGFIIGQDKEYKQEQEPM